MSDEKASLISLSQAVALYRLEPGAHANAYEWFRQHAHRDGCVSIGGYDVPVAKVDGRWQVQTADLERGLVVHRERQAHFAKVTADYHAHVLHGEDDDNQYIEGGGYRLAGVFHFRWSNYEIGRRKSDGSWYCNTCFALAREEHGREECVRCANGYYCSDQCTLTELSCPTCGTAQSMPHHRFAVA